MDGADAVQVHGPRVVDVDLGTSPDGREFRYEPLQHSGFQHGSQGLETVPAHECPDEALLQAVCVPRGVDEIQGTPHHVSGVRRKDAPEPGLEHEYVHEKFRSDCNGPGVDKRDEPVDMPEIRTGRT